MQSETKHLYVAVVVCYALNQGRWCFWRNKHSERFRQNQDPTSSHCCCCSLPSKQGFTWGFVLFKFVVLNCQCKVTSRKGHWLTIMLLATVNFRIKFFRQWCVVECHYLFLFMLMPSTFATEKSRCKMHTSSCGKSYMSSISLCSVVATRFAPGWWWTILK